MKFRFRTVAGARCKLLDVIRAIPVLLILSISVVIAAQMPGQQVPGPRPAHVDQTSHGIRATAGTEVLEVTVCTDSVIHVVATPEPSAPASPRPWMLDGNREIDAEAPLERLPLFMRADSIVPMVRKSSTLRRIRQG